ncbi:hypothetical protein, partial [Priestia megaterium]|uniref:hypothetical protein n=1 Tax=Priestia megaterium TaxID=1404 RepID=UPI0035B684D9
MSWSITGNEIDSGYLDGIDVFEDISLWYGISCLDYTVSCDISGNTLTDVRDYGISYELSRIEQTSGTIEMNINVDIKDNV